MIKRITYLVLFFVLFLTSCKDEKDCCVFPEEIITTLNFTHNWNGRKITNQELNELIEMFGGNEEPFWKVKMNFYKNWERIQLPRDKALKFNKWIQKNQKI